MKQNELAFGAEAQQATREQLAEALRAGTLDDAFDGEELKFLFASLDPVDTDFMLGIWQGSGVPSGHPMDGLLEVLDWYGKSFVSTEEVFPLLFHRKGKIFSVDPWRMPMGASLGWLGNVVRVGGRASALFLALIRPFVTTRKARARLRMVESYGQPTAAMVYDHLPIIDSFRRLDDDTVLGLMDFRGDVQPFFFRMRRSKSGDHR